MNTRQTRANALTKEILDAAKELREKKIIEPLATAAVAILAAQLIKSSERIERLEGDIQTLTDLLAGLEKTQ